ncbi:DUF7089 family protein [Halapricum salinum]|uniref:Uncharacterized protein n=1 Tax=Halapricum salinum TaxID=1457250 RepID=A0A4D6HDP2_9EURY|nr:hypothetical protein [Halapricum salinum]QCC51268.1 hypothetical protein DV733_08420 [Halapricum salinum]
MFDERDLSAPVERVRTEHAPDALVLDVDRDFETLPPATAEQLGLVVDSLEPASYPESWLPADAPELLVQYASETFTVGAPGDGGVAWTRQTDPAVVLVKPRLAGSPESFVDFLLAEALVQIGLDAPEQFLGYFEQRYRDLTDAVAGRLDSAGTYQLAAALYEGYLGLHTRPIFAEWADDQPELHDAWVDAGERLQPRLADLSSDVASGRTDFGDAAELACSAIKHEIEVPPPFAALDTGAYREHGAAFAVEWAERVLGE